MANEIKMDSINDVIEEIKEVGEEYEVLRVRDHAFANGKYRFLIEFKGYPDRQDWSFVDDDECFCESAIQDYFRSRGMRINTVHCFARVSTKGQSGPMHVSLETQERRIKETARAKWGANIRIKMHKISCSAYKGIPTQLEQITENMVAGDILAVYRIDRLSRNIVKFLSYLEDLDQKGIRIFSCEEGIWYNNNRLDFIQGIVNANRESEMLGRRVRESVKFRRERGDYIGTAPFGYKKIRDEATGRVLLVSNIEEKAVLDDLRKWYNNKAAQFGYRTEEERKNFRVRFCREIAQWMRQKANEMNFHGNCRGKNWTAAKIKSALFRDH